MEEFIFNLIHNTIHENAFLSYVFFFISGILQMTFPPFPSDVIIIFQGYLTTIGDKFLFPVILLNSVMGSLIGSGLVYWFGYTKGNEVLKYKMVQKFIDKKNLKRSEKVLHKYGKYGLLLSKFIPGTSTIMVLISGIFKIKTRVYLSYIVYSVILQQIVYLLIGRVIGRNIDKVKNFLSVFNFISVSILVVLAVIVYLIIASRKVKSSKTVK